MNELEVKNKIGVVLFNFGDDDFVVNMGDRIAQLIFEKIKTPKIKELEELDGTDRGASGYGSTRTGVVLLNENKGEETTPKVQKDAVNLSQSRQIISARQVSKLAKGDNPVFLAIVRAKNEDTK